jgi:hypothetical protein
MGQAARLVGRWKTTSAFAGFDGQTLVRLENGLWWLQASVEVWQHFDLRPTVEIHERDGAYLLGIAGQPVRTAFRPVTRVSACRMVDVFHGWTCGVEYALQNGECWRQVDGTRRTRYVWRPEALVYRDDAGYWMEAGNTRARVTRVRSAAATRAGDCRCERTRPNAATTPRTPLAAASH